jgi:hypothetical protein
MIFRYDPPPDDAVPTLGDWRHVGMTHGDIAGAAILAAWGVLLSPSDPHVAVHVDFRVPGGAAWDAYESGFLDAYATWQESEAA